MMEPQAALRVGCLQPTNPEPHERNKMTDSQQQNGTADERR